MIAADVGRGQILGKILPINVNSVERVAHNEISDSFGEFHMKIVLLLAYGQPDACFALRH